MPYPAPNSAQQTPPAPAAKVKPGCLQDIGWGRPVFRAPELPSPGIVFDPMPFRAGFSIGQRPAAGR
jgi:hypothetical protein